MPQHKQNVNNFLAKRRNKTHNQCPLFSVMLISSQDLLHLSVNLLQLDITVVVKVMEIVYTETPYIWVFSRAFGYDFFIEFNRRLKWVAKMESSSPQHYVQRVTYTKLVLFTTFFRPLPLVFHSITELDFLIRSV